MSAELLSELARVKAMFQLRAIQTVMGLPEQRTCATCGQPLCDHTDHHWNTPASPAGEGEVVASRFPTNPEGLSPDAQRIAGEGGKRLSFSPATLSGERV